VFAIFANYVPYVSRASKSGGSCPPRSYSGAAHARKDTWIRASQKSEEEEKIQTVSSLKLGTWNVRTLNTTEKEELLERMNMNFIGLTETKRKGPGRHYYTHEGSFMMHSKAEHWEHGVGAIVDKWTAKKVIGYEGVNDRIMIVRLAASPYNVTICIVYAPTSAHSDVEVENFYEQMTEALKSTTETYISLSGISIPKLERQQQVKQMGVSDLENAMKEEKGCCSSAGNKDM